MKKDSIKSVQGSNVRTPHTPIAQNSGKSNTRTRAIQKGKNPKAKPKPNYVTCLECRYHYNDNDHDARKVHRKRKYGNPKRLCSLAAKDLRFAGRPVKYQNEKQR